MYLISGVTGNTGGVVASELLQEGKPIRVIVRSDEKGEPWKDRGAEVAVTSLDDVKGLTRALKGVTAFYFLVPPNMQSKDMIADYRRFATAVKQALTNNPIERGVYLSAWGTHIPNGPFPMHREAEETLSYLQTPFTFLRAAFFMENLESLIPAIQEHGVLPSVFRQTQKIPMVAAQDIGEVAVAALLGRPKPPAIIELTGPKEYSMDDVAITLSGVLLKAIRTVRIPLEDIPQSLVQNGASKEVGEFYQNMIEAFEQGRASIQGGPATFLRGRISLEEYATKLMSTRSTNRAYLH